MSATLVGIGLVSSEIFDAVKFEPLVLPVGAVSWAVVLVTAPAETFALALRLTAGALSGAPISPSPTT